MEKRDTFDLDPYDMVEFANKWLRLGDCITSQVIAILRGDDPFEQNYNALKTAAEELEGFNEEIDSQLKDAINAFGEEFPHEDK